MSIKLSSSAKELLEAKPYLDTAVTTEITDVGACAPALKAYLAEYFSPTSPVVIDGKARTLSEIDDGVKTVIILGNPSYEKSRYSFPDLLRIMGRLTAPDGCSWDRAQTHESIRGNMIEEAYEAVDAIDDGDVNAMREEFGDVLLQAIFHCNMAEKNGEFTTGDVISELCTKLCSRHTHIFGADKATNPAEALKFWENAKAVEKNYKSLYDILCRLPKGFPSLLRAEKAIKKAVKAGLKEKSEPVSEAELKSKLFELCARAAASGIDAETALNAKIAEFIEEYRE